MDGQDELECFGVCGFVLILAPSERSVKRMLHGWSQRHDMPGEIGDVYLMFAASLHG